MIKYGIAALALFPVWGTLVWFIWQSVIRPSMIDGGIIEALSDELIARYGADAETIACIEEDRAWRYSQTFEQGRWRRIKRELQRRREAGEWPEEAIQPMDGVESSQSPSSV